MRGIPLTRLREVRESTIREGKPVSRRQLAEGAGVDYSMLWRLEEGRNGAGYRIANALARYLGRTVEDIAAPDFAGVA